MNTSSVTAKPEAKLATDKVVPSYMAHIVLKTEKYREMVAWYQTVFHATATYNTDIITFLTFDGEHHRFAFIDISKKGVKPMPNTIGVAHFAYTYHSVEDLMHTYERLKAIDIVPSRSTNHDLTASLYYRDPDGNEMELQADIFATEEAGKAVFTSEKFLQTPFGRPYDPETFSQRFHEGVPFENAMAEAEAAIA